MFLINWWMAVGISLALLIGLVAGVNQEIDGVTKKREMIRSLEIKIETNKKLLIDNNEIEKKYLALTSLSSQFTAYRLMSVVFHLYQEAILSGLSVEVIKPNALALKENETGGVVKISSEGTFRELDAFLYSIRRAHLPLSLRNFSMHVLNNHWRMIIYFRVFSIGSAKLNSQNQVKDYFSAEEWLTHFPVSQLRYIGFIRKNNFQWAIVKLPNEKVFVIQIGSRIGEEVLQVVKITDEKILFEDKQNHVFYLKRI